MLRIGLTVYLMLATFMGPALCCCTIARLSAATPTLAQPEEPEKPHSCCCCEQSLPPDASPQLGEPPDHPPQPTDHDPASCPCKQHPTNPMTTGVLASSTFDDLRTLEQQQQHTLFLLPVSVGVAPQPMSVVPDESPGLFMTGRDRLCALQVFRC